MKAIDGEDCPMIPFVNDLDEPGRFLVNEQMKICPTCGAETPMLIVNVATQQRFCHHCSGRVCPTFMPHYVLTAEDVAWLRACGIDPEMIKIENLIKPDN
jgi:ribosomal protein S27AE